GQPAQQVQVRDRRPGARARRRRQVGRALLEPLSRRPGREGGRLMKAPIQPPALDGGMPQAVAGLKRELARRGIDLAYRADGATVMNGGSTTLEQIGFLEALANGPYDWLRPGIAAIADPDERIRVRRRAGTADYFVGGINAVTEAGEILNADGGGNRVAAYAYGAGKLFLVAGVNKIVPDIAAAFERLRNVAAVEECRHLGASTPCALTGRCDN